MEEHRDDVGARMGMWIFIFTELLLFGGLFLVYAIFRNQYSDNFHTAAHELNAFVGALNTVILLISSATVAMAITAVQKGNKSLALILVGITLSMALLFLINKYFEWGHHIKENIYPGSPVLASRGQGDVLFYGLYYFMTGLHALHIIIGLVFIGFIARLIIKDRIVSDNYVLLENSGLYWHLVDLIWIFLFPLFYLIT